MCVANTSPQVPKPDFPYSPSSHKQNPGDPLPGNLSCCAFLGTPQAQRRRNATPFLSLRTPPNERIKPYGEPPEKRKDCCRCRADASGIPGRIVGRRRLRLWLAWKLCDPYVPKFDFESLTGARRRRRHHHLRYGRAPFLKEVAVLAR